MGDDGSRVSRLVFDVCRFDICRRSKQVQTIVLSALCFRLGRGGGGVRTSNKDQNELFLFCCFVFYKMNVKVFKTIMRFYVFVFL